MGFYFVKIFYIEIASFDAFFLVFQWSWQRFACGLQWNVWGWGGGLGGVGRPETHIQHQI